MARVRKISINPNPRENYYPVHANFLVNRFVLLAIDPNAHQKQRIESCNEWWEEIETPLERSKPQGCVPDVCIAQSFKTVAKEYYEEKWFKTPVEFNNARKNLGKRLEPTG